MTTSTWGPWNFLDRPESHPVEVLIVVAHGLRQRHPVLLAAVRVNRCRRGRDGPAWARGCAGFADLPMVVRAPGGLPSYLGDGAGCGGVGYGGHGSGPGPGTGGMGAGGCGSPGTGPGPGGTGGTGGTGSGPGPGGTGCCNSTGGVVIE
jgi:hypothetical protein